MDDKAKITVFRVLWVATGCLWAVQVVRVIRGDPLDAGPVAVVWLTVWGLFLLAAPWSASARRAAKASKRASDTAR